jgi:hypothetical protein
MLRPQKGVDQPIAELQEQPDLRLFAFNSDEAVQTIPTGQLIAKTQYDTKFNNGAFEILHVFSPALLQMRSASFGRV